MKKPEIFEAGQLFKHTPVYLASEVSSIIKELKELKEKEAKEKEEMSRLWDEVQEMIDELCYCGKPINEKFSPCCSYECWSNKFEKPKDISEELGNKRVLFEVSCERSRQDEKWGEQNHKPTEWLAILGEEFGEVSKAVCEAHFSGYENTNNWDEYRNELIQVAAVAVAMIESHDRNIKMKKI